MSGKVEKLERRKVISSGVLLLLLAGCVGPWRDPLGGIHAPARADSGPTRRIDHYDTAGRRTGYSLEHADGRVDHYDTLGRRTGTSVTSKE